MLLKKLLKLDDNFFIFFVSEVIELEKVGEIDGLLI